MRNPVLPLSLLILLSLLLFACGGGSDIDGDTTADGDTLVDGDTTVDGDTDIDGDTSVDGDTAGDELVSLTILHTSDMHHHASGFGPFLDYTPLDQTDNDDVEGGYARLATAIAGIRAEQASAGVPVLLLDSGDFMMGSIYDLTAADPLAFRFFELAGYDAVTLGNHEFDWTPAGLAMLIAAARASAGGFEVPVVASNIVFSEAGAGDDDLAALAGAGAIVPKKTIELPGGLKVGILGLMGPDAEEKAPLADPVAFRHLNADRQTLVDSIRADGAELVIALSHGGINPDGTGDDEKLARFVTGIDVVASGHFHTATPEPFRFGNTLVFEPGSYGTHLARLDLVYNRTQGRIDDFDFQLIPIDDAIPGDTTVQAVIEEYHTGIAAALAPLGFAPDTPVSKTAFPLELAGFDESGLGNLVADAERTIASLAVQSTADPTPFALAVVPSGVIRDGFVPGSTGTIAFADAYAVLPLGISPDTTQAAPGYPLIAAYLTGPEIRNVAEASVTIAPLKGEDYVLNFSGIRFEYDPDGTPFEKVTSVTLCGTALPAAAGGGEDWFSAACLTPLDLSDQTSLHRVVVDLYALQMLHVVTGVGLIIQPKDAAGRVIDLTDPNDYMQFRIDADPSTPAVEELKEWMALVRFLTQFFPADGAGIEAAVYGPGGLALGRVGTL